jgi:UPF0176 protein
VRSLDGDLAIWYQKGMAFTIAAFYRFVTIADPAALREELCNAFSADELCGSMLIAPEGINGTMAGSQQTMERLLQLLADRTGLPRQDVKFASSEERPFGRLKFLVKAEIIAFRKASVNPEQAGQYIDPQQWNRLIADPEVLVLDTRNRYETELGTFSGAIDPGLETFSDFVTYVREHLDPARHRKVAMYCTGGIRCEKASAFMRQEGFPEVYHLKGGILRYLEDIPAEDSQWNGTCFVFDRRTSVGHSDFQS